MTDRIKKIYFNTKINCLCVNNHLCQYEYELPYPSIINLSNEQQSCCSTTILYRSDSNGYGNGASSIISLSCQQNLVVLLLAMYFFNEVLQLTMLLLLHKERRGYIGISNVQGYDSHC